MLFAALARAGERLTLPFFAKTCKSELIEITTIAIGMAWAFSFAGMHTTSVVEWIHEVVTRLGHTFDALHAKKVE